MRQAGVPVIKFSEGGRHTAVSLRHDADIAEDISMRQAGHSMVITHRRYTHRQIETHLEAVQQVADLISKAGGQA